MLCVDILIARIATRHHIGIGEDGAIDLTLRQCFAQFLHIKRFDGNIRLLAEIVPRLDAVEHLEDQDAKQHIFGTVSVQVLIDDVLYQILTHAVASAIDVGEFILAQDRVVSKSAAILAPTPEDVHPFLNEVEVIFQNVVVGNNSTGVFIPHKYLTWAD